jgi:hypothetical protein
VTKYKVCRGPRGIWSPPESAYKQVTCDLI